MKTRFWALLLALSLGWQTGTWAADTGKGPKVGDKAAADAKDADDVLPGYKEVKLQSLKAMLPDLKEQKITFVACYDNASTDIWGPVSESGFKNGRDYSLGFRLKAKDGMSYYTYSYINGYAKHVKEITDMLATLEAGQWVRVYGTVHKSRASRYYHDTVPYIEVEIMKPTADPQLPPPSTVRTVEAPATPPVGGPPVGGTKTK